MAQGHSHKKRRRNCSWTTNRDLSPSPFSSSHPACPPSRAAPAVDCRVLFIVFSRPYSLSSFVSNSLLSLSSVISFSLCFSLFSFSVFPIWLCHIKYLLLFIFILFLFSLLVLVFDSFWLLLLLVFHATFQDLPFVTFEHIWALFYSRCFVLISFSPQFITLIRIYSKEKYSRLFLVTSTSDVNSFDNLKTNWIQWFTVFI